MKKLLAILFIAFIIIQFFPIDKTNPAVNKQMDFLTVKETPAATAALIRASCYDCHSNESKYPWYSNIAPASWLLKHHIDEGRAELNFSSWATYEPKRQLKKLDESAEMIEHGEMPMEGYILMHPEAKLTPEQRRQLAAYFRNMEKESAQYFESVR